MTSVDSIIIIIEGTGPWGEAPGVSKVQFQHQEILVRIPALPLPDWIQESHSVKFSCPPIKEAQRHISEGLLIRFKELSREHAQQGLGTQKCPTWGCCHNEDAFKGHQIIRLRLSR